MSGVLLEIESSNGNLNLSPYLNVQEGEGMDPADPQFTTKVWAHSLLKPGGTLALEDFKVRELTYPLTLKAKSKDLLTAMVREINTLINTAGAEVEWSDEGTSVSTFFQLASGQCDPEYFFRPGQQTEPMLKAKLRLFVQPFGVKEKTLRELSVAAGGTGTATAPVLTFHTASPPAGDVGALTRGIIKQTTVARGPGAFAVLPNASYVPWIPAASMSATGWISGASEGFGYIAGGGKKELNITRQQFVYSGSNRVLAIARLFNTASPANLVVQGGFLGTTNTVAIPAASSAKPFSVVDCGVFARPSLPALEANPWQLSLTPSATISLYGIVMLPDNATCWEINSGEETEFDGLSGRIIDRELEFDVTGEARGAIPLTPPAVAPTFAFFSFPPTAKPSKYSVKVSIQERARYVF